MNRFSTPFLAALSASFCAFAIVTARADVCSDNPFDGPTVCVGWHLPTEPIEEFNFTIDYESNPSAPDVELLTGALWRVYSVDPAAPDFVGDIGEIRCPYAQNFAVSIRNDSYPSLIGARTVKAIRLVPSNGDNYANLTETRIMGLTEELIVAPDSTGDGGGGAPEKGTFYFSPSFSVGRGANGRCRVPLDAPPGWSAIHANIERDVV